VKAMLYIISASYDAVLNGISLKLYNDETEKIEEWIDMDFKAYFLTRSWFDRKWKSIIKKEKVKRYDALRDKSVEMCKVTLDNPRAVKQSHDVEDAYENHIKFFQNFIYEKDIKMGMPHMRVDGKLEFWTDNNAENRIQEILNLFKNLSNEERVVFNKWAELLEYPAPDFKRASLDIEVLNENENQIPDSNSAVLPVLTVCLATNKGERIALVLAQNDKKIEKVPENITKVMFFTNEAELLRTLFQLMKNYPFIITFNGDDFDLKYLYNRAIRLGIPDGEIPLIIRQKISMIQTSIHIDLYKFFFIKAMRIYAFKAKYKNVDLDSVAKALIKRGKIDTGKWVKELNYYDLMKYCMNDAEITLELTTYNNNLVMNLILMLQRISRMPIENVSRKSVSNWIRSFMIYEHRQRNILIPSPEEIKAVKGEIKSEAVIKGKKYKGAIVFPPVVGTHFKTKVCDFASLYPSIIKVYNIGYSTINCPHEECKSNTIGELPHWICTKHKALESLLIGSLRDLRVFWYKKKAKDDSLDKELKMWYSVAEQSIKVIMNASYGVFGAESFVFYCPPVAEEITAIARHIIEKTAEHAVQMGLDVLYGDTDSIFIRDPPEDKLKELIEWTLETYGIEFEVDKSYRYVCLSARKKNYLGVLEDGEVDVKGLTGKKKHTPKIIKDAFNDTKEILSKIKSLEEMDVGKGEIIKLIKELYNTFKHRKWEHIEDLAFHVTTSKELDEYVKNVPQHVKAARMLVNQGHKIGSGTNISYVKTRKRVKGKRGFKWVTDVKPTELAKKEDIDVNKYIEFFKSTFKQLLDPLDISFEEDVLGVTKLERWQKT